VLVQGMEGGSTQLLIGRGRGMLVRHVVLLARHWQQMTDTAMLGWCSHAASEVSACLACAEGRHSTAALQAKLPRVTALRAAGVPSLSVAFHSSCETTAAASCETTAAGICGALTDGSMAASWKR
jgi:hypothetical protein